MANNKNYQQAIAHVKGHYPDLYYHAERINLVFVGRMMHNTLGTCSDRRIIQIANKRQPTALFVRTLIHELTHAEQFSNGRVRGVVENDVRELEAEKAGQRAAAFYTNNAA